MNFPEQVTTAIETIKEHGMNCVFCADHVPQKPGLIGMTNFTGNAAILMGAPPNKDRLAFYTVCFECVEKYPTQEMMSEAVDVEIARQQAIFNKETLQ